MSVIELKEQLHHAINNIDNKNLLEAMLTIINAAKEPFSYSLTNEQLHILQEREQQFLKGESKTITPKEFKEKMNRKYGL